MNSINQTEFEKTLKKYNVIKNDEIRFLDDILKSFSLMDLMYRTNQNTSDINVSLENKITSIKSLHDNSYLYLQRIYDEYSEAFAESNTIMENIDVSGGIK